METVKPLSVNHAGRDVFQKLRHYEVKKIVACNSGGKLEHHPYVIKLKTGVVLFPKNRARFSTLCHQRIGQIETAFVRLDPYQNPDAIYMLIQNGRLT